MIKSIYNFSSKIKLIVLCIFISIIVTLIFGMIFVTKKYLGALFLFMVLIVLFLSLIKGIRGYAYSKYIEKDSLPLGDLVVSNKFLTVEIYDPINKIKYAKRTLSYFYLSKLKRYKVRYALLNKKVVFINIEK
ncbi:MAG: hypothetical protein E7176_02220 [Erysipelotrichaceae bacterium]|nr:hypothetical protein [Erysipelotrichaceae bacterium]